MRYSNYFLPTLRDDPKEAESISHKLSLKAGLLNLLASGIFSYLPIGLKVLRNIEGIIREYMNLYGAQEVLLPALQPLELWQKTKRDEVLKEVMFQFRDRRNRVLCLGPTHEEVITDLARKFLSSYKQLPVILYQIQTKFRDELRPRFGLVRSCEFVMKDAYSFDKDADGLAVSYHKMREAYQNIFRVCGLSPIVLEADVGAMGGSQSEEFLIASESGEDSVWQCSGCGKYFKTVGSCAQCARELEEKKALEIGHIFKLGNKYSKDLGASVLTDQGVRSELLMGCYGIGVSRLISAIIETHHDAEGIIWPNRVAPFDFEIVILGKDPELESFALDLYEKAKALGYAVLLDDRNESAGVKFNDAFLLGLPYLVVIGLKNFSQGKVEITLRQKKERFLVDSSAVLPWFDENT